MFEFIDVFIVGAILYYIVQAIRRAAAKTDRRPPGSIAAEEGESLTWAERTQRALEGALEWEEEQDRKREEARLRAEIAEIRAAERGSSTPWGERRDQQRKALEEAQRDEADPSLSDALAGVAAMLEQREASAPAERTPELFRPPARREARDLTPREQPAPPARRGRTELTRRPRPPIEAPVLEVEAQEIRATRSTVERRSSGQALADLPGMGRLTPLQRAIVYGEIFGRPVALGGGLDDDSLD